MLRRALILVLLCSACAKKPTAPPTLPVPVREGGGAGCQRPMWQPGEERPGGIEIENQSADSVIVFLIRCRGSTRVADIGPNETDVYVLPDGAVNFSGQLRFHTYRGTERSFASALVLPVGEPYLKLVIPEAARPECSE